MGAAICFFQFDEKVFTYLKENPQTWQKTFWPQVIKQLGKNYDLIWLLLVWVAFTGKRKTVITCILSLLITLAAVTITKETVGRVRPRDTVKQEANGKVKHKTHSFPSGDTASVFAAGTVLAYAAPLPVTVGFAGCCCGVGLLRVIELAHYPSDVFAGAAVGIFCGWLATRIRKWKPQIENLFGGLERIISIAGVIIIPVIVWFSQGPDNFKILIMFYFPAAAVMLMAEKLMSRQTE